MASRSASTGARPGARPSRPPVRDFTGGSPSFRIEWDVRPAFDLVFSLSSDSGGDDLPAPDRAWLTDAKASLPEPVRSYLGREHRADMLIHVGAFLVERTEVRTSSQVVDALRGATPVDVFRTLLDEPGADTGEIEQALDGNRKAIAAVRARLKGHKAEALGKLLDDPDRAYGEVIDVMAAWAPVFAPIEGRIETIIQRDYDLRAADRASLGEVELVEKTTGGIRIVPDPAIERVILAPTYFARPFNYLFAGKGWRFDGYPVADAAFDVDPLSPPTSVLRVHRALGDATRLRILKALADKDLYGTELAEQLEISKATITHHMAQLRAAGLVTAVQAGSAVYYSLRRERVQEALNDLTSFLVG
jgi:DNA-binding transcriptional ArsR family regulator